LVPVLDIYALDASINKIALKKVLITESDILVQLFRKWMKLNIA